MLLFLVGKALNTPWNSCGCLYYWYGVLCKISSWQQQPEFCLNLSSTRWSTKSNYKSKSIWANEAKVQLVITSNDYEKSPPSTQSTEKRTHMHRKTFFYMYVTYSVLWSEGLCQISYRNYSNENSGSGIWHVMVDYWVLSLIFIEET